MKIASPLNRIFAYTTDAVLLFFLDLVVTGLVFRLTNPLPKGEIIGTLGWTFDFTSPANIMTSLINISYFVILTAIWGGNYRKKVIGY